MADRKIAEPTGKFSLGAISGVSGALEAIEKKSDMEEPPSLLAVDSEGDLRFEVGQDTEDTTRTLIVCSKAVARASKLFRTMLFGGFAEGNRNTTSDWTIALPEDNAEAFTTLMHIVHANFNMVPVFVTRDQLYEITILTDKYSMTEVLRPWANAWVSPFVAPYVPSAAGDERLIWIAWELGHRQLFKDTLTFLLLNASANSSRTADKKLPRPVHCPDWPELESNIRVAFLGVLGKSSMPSVLAFECTQ